MSIPKLSFDALAARVRLDSKTLLVMVEGFQDRGLLSGWIEEQKLAAVCYSIDEVEFELDLIGAVEGGNKGRITALLKVDDIVPYADGNIIGVVDVDVDIASGAVVAVNGLYYTEYTCLFNRVATRENFEAIGAGAFGKPWDNAIWADIERFGRRHFALRCLKQTICPDANLPRVDRCMLAVDAGGFDWAEFGSRLIAASGGRITQKQIDTALSEADSASADFRHRSRFHTTKDYTIDRLRREKLLPANVSSDELFRHLRMAAFSSLRSCNIATLIVAKANALQ